MDDRQATVRAVIDFVRFRLETPDGPIERTEHDITARNLEARIQRLKDRHGALSDPVPIGMEVAMDLFVAGDDLDTLAEITADLWRLNVANISPNQRIYGARHQGKPTAPPTDRKKLATKLRAGYQLAEGNQDDPIYRHAYLKLSDDAGRIAQRRPCARLEFRLQGEACPFDTLDALRCFDWKELRRWFRFRRLRDDLDQLETVVGNNSDRIGKRRTRDRVSQEEGRRKGTREFSRLTVSDVVLNRKVDDAFKVMTRRWLSLRVTSETGDLPGNVGQIPVETRADTGTGRITTQGIIARVGVTPKLASDSVTAVGDSGGDSPQVEQVDQAASAAPRLPGVTRTTEGEMPGTSWPYPETW